MLVQCPNCKSLFDLPETSFTASKFRCSTCKHIWQNQHKLMSVAENKPTPLLNWIFLWSAIGMISVALYIGYPRLDNYLADLKTHLFGNNTTSFILKDASNNISEVTISYKSEEGTSFNLMDTNQEISGD